MPAPPPACRLRFATIDDALAEADRLTAAERAGRLGRTGNWTLGEALGHLAAWADYAYDGFPPAIRAPWPVRVVVRWLFLRRALAGPMPAGLRIGETPGGTYGIDPLPADEGLRRFGAAVNRLRAAAPPAPHPLFGPLAHAQWVQMHLRHAELHLGFLVPE